MSTLYLKSSAAASVDPDSSDGSYMESSATAHQVDEMDTTERDQVKEVEEMAKRETKNLRVWKFVVFLTILATATLVATGTHIFLERDQDSSFEESYYAYANTIGDGAQVKMRTLFSALRSCSNSISGAAIVSNSTFPFVTVPAFELLGQSVRQQSGAELIVFTPKIEEAEVTRWEEYATANEGWYEESKQLAILSKGSLIQSAFATGNFVPFIHSPTLDENGNLSVMPANDPPFYPIWQHSPPPFSASLIKANIPEIDIEPANVAREAVLGATFFSDPTGLTKISSKEEDHKALHDKFKVSAATDSAYDRPHVFVYQPIFREIYKDSSEVVGDILALITWDRYFGNLLPAGVKGITCVATSTCGESFTYFLDGNTAFYAGEGDMHDENYNHMKIEIPFSDFLRNSTKDVPGHCMYTIAVYPTKEFEEKYRSNLPALMTLCVAVAFCFMIVTFLAYDCFVQLKNEKVVSAAARSNAILSSLFPKNVRDRLFAEKAMEEEEKNTGQKRPLLDLPGNKARLTSFLNNDADGMELEEDADEDDFMYKTKPIADLFPETTILFADISGFTAWSSTREPSQVFVLLETIYKAFDEIAKRRGVFKVETVGDCYVAVTGLPKPRKDHAVTMARFARDCMHRMHQLTRKLEVVLGPDTADLSIRIGLHSGPVTAGVLRGERSRFQLFGDTMNTASRMESTGLRDKIQVSQDTADLLLAAGKTKWLTTREEKVVAKGKGEMQTYWVAVGNRKKINSEGNSTVGGDDDAITEAQGNFYPAVCAKTARLVMWNVDVLATLLKQVHAERDGTNVTPLEKESQDAHLSKLTVLEEVKEIIHLPTFSGQKTKNQDNIALNSVVLEQLEDYVSAVASMYRDNPFHNFEHASHVVMSVVKLLSRIVVPDISEETGKDMASTLHDHTYGITSDPLTQFACVFSALIHDADHTGVPNTQLINENSNLAKIYKDKSVAEQNSVDLCWDLLMDSNFDELRTAIYSTDDERKRFRQLVVNSVMATDIMDKDLKMLRNNRWDKAFSDEASAHEESKEDAVDRKATIVIEHLIQASDVSHTMQHWHIYRKWNARLFEELYRAYVDGRSDNDPSEFWYKGEMGFFDFYIIPLAKKLKNCGVFGVSSDEYLNYATKNRQEWEDRGLEVVAALVEDTQAKLAAENVEAKAAPMLEIKL